MVQRDMSNCLEASRLRWSYWIPPGLVSPRLPAGLVGVGGLQGFLVVPFFAVVGQNWVLEGAQRGLVLQGSERWGWLNVPLNFEPRSPENLAVIIKV